jgi:hypothetical protein
MAYIQRQYSDFTTNWTIRLSTMGYALPGTVLAVGVVIMASFADRQIIWILKETSGIQLNSILNGTIVTVIFAYTVRFSASKNPHPDFEKWTLYCCHACFCRCDERDAHYLDDAAIWMGYASG